MNENKWPRGEKKHFLAWIKENFDGLVRWKYGSSKKNEYGLVLTLKGKRLLQESKEKTNE